MVLDKEVLFILCSYCLLYFRNFYIVEFYLITMGNQKIVVCEITGKKKSIHETKPFGIIRPGIQQMILKKYPNIDQKGYISMDVLNEFRKGYIENMLIAEKGDLSKLDKDVVKSMVKNEVLSKNVNPQHQKKLSFGQKLSDDIAAFGGSWRFIIIFGCILFVWVVINSIYLLSKPFDPFPFILLNLLLSCLAAMQAPVIMMSQNRKEVKDRERAENDYKINLKAEL